MGYERRGLEAELEHTAEGSEGGIREVVHLVNERVAAASSGDTGDIGVVAIVLRPCPEIPANDAEAGVAELAR